MKVCFSEKRNARSSRGSSLIEVLIVFMISAILMALLLGAVQKIRGSATRLECQNQLRQLGLGLILQHDSHRYFPPGHRSQRSLNSIPFTGWTYNLLPFLDQNPILQLSQIAFISETSPFEGKHPLGNVVPHFLCPGDSRVASAKKSLRSGHRAAFTSYLGISGIQTSEKNGVLFQDSAIRLVDVLDGASHTLLLGERPPSTDFQFGWWYAGAGQRLTGSADLILGVREPNLLPIFSGSSCGPGSYSFKESRFSDPCGMFHYWSPHTAGANFAFVDGSVRFLSYGNQETLEAHATIASGEW